MKEVVVLSGKGGTGKTMLLASYAALAEDAVAADCDVDAPNMHLILQPRIVDRGPFTASKVAVIDARNCTNCMKCLPLCRFNAIRTLKNHNLEKVILYEDCCEGCGVCMRACPQRAVRLETRQTGEWFMSETRYGWMAHALLEPGGENSGMLVATVKQKAKQKAEEVDAGLVLVDGPPGIGCSAISALSGADLAVIVTEPTRSGVSDFRRIVELIRGFDTQLAFVVNRYDINEEITKSIEVEAFDAGIHSLGLIPYDDAVVSSMAVARAVVEENDGPASSAIERSWRRLLDMLNDGAPKL